MKIKNAFCLFVASILLVGCNNSSNGSWEKEIKDKMVEVLGHELPYIDLKDYTFSYDDYYEDWEICALAQGNRNDEYAKKLDKMSGYELVEHDEEYEYYAYQKDFDPIVIDEVTTKYTYNLVSSQSFKGDLYIGFNQYTYERYSNWPLEVASFMNETFKESVPFPTQFMVTSEDVEYSAEDGIVEVSTAADTFAEGESIARTYASSLTNYVGSFEEESSGDLKGIFHKGLEETIKIGGDDYQTAIAVEISVKDLLDTFDIVLVEIMIYLDVLPFTSNLWPNEFVDSFLSGCVDTLPALEASSYVYMGSGEETYDSILIECLGVSEDTLDDYLDALGKKMFYVVEDDESPDYLYYFVPWEEEYEVSVYEIESGYAFEISLLGKAETYDEFPLDDLIYCLGVDESLGEEIVPFISDSEYGYKLYVSDDFTDQYVAIEAVDPQEGETTLMESYAEALTTKGYEVEEPSLLYPYYSAYGQYFEVYFLENEYGYFTSYFYASGPVDGPMISFEDDSALTSYDPEEAVWECSFASFIVSKGTSSIDVGNEDGRFLYDPLRIYSGQEITLSWSSNILILSIEFDCDGSSYATALEGASIIGGTMSRDSYLVTVTPNEQVNTITITLNSQVRLNSVTFESAAN